MVDNGELKPAVLDPSRWGFRFNGQYRHALDEKGRVSVPVLFRRDDTGNAIGRYKVTVGFERCLFLFPAAYWRGVVEPQLLELSVMERRARQVSRMFLARAADCEPDRQGRILVPAPLREYAGLNGDVIVNGMLTRVEIWNVERWFAYEREAQAAFEETADSYHIRF